MQKNRDSLKKRSVKKRQIPITITVFFTLLVVGVLLYAILIFYFAFMNPFPSLDPRNTEVISLEQSDKEAIIILDAYMDSKYTKVIYPEGKERISSELDKIRNISNPQAKLDEIFIWEMKDWIFPNDNISAFVSPNTAHTYSYLASNLNRIKASPYYNGILYPQENPNGTMYADDPIWIAYNKVGECREDSTLFAYMAQESGIDAHLVLTPSHQWVEVELAGQSYYYDPWCADSRGYYNATDGNMTFRDKWFNTIGSFEENCKPPDPYPISYTTFPYVWATPKYVGATVWHSLGKGLNNLSNE